MFSKNIYRGGCFCLGMKGGGLYQGDNRLYGFERNVRAGASCVCAGVRVRVGARMCPCASATPMSCVRARVRVSIHLIDLSSVYVRPLDRLAVADQTQVALQLGLEFSRGDLLDRGLGLVTPHAAGPA